MRKSLLVLISILSAVMLLAIACGSDEADPNATNTPAPPNTIPAADRATEPPPPPTAMPAEDTPVPSGGTGATAGGTVELAIDVNGDALEFNTASLSAAAGSEVVVTFNNSSSVNSHNWALVEAGTKDDVATAGLAAGQDNNWLPSGDSRLLGATILLGPGESGQATFTAPAAGEYQFVCTFPGHNITMFGTFTVN